jgi:titin
LINQFLPGITIVDQVISGDKQITLITLTTENGGSPINDYQYSTDDGLTWKSIGGTGTEINIFTVSSSDDQLENNVTYKVGIRAINYFGAGPSSDFVEVTPAVTVTGTPGKVETDSFISFNKRIYVGFWEPDNGSDFISDYEYSTDDGLTWKSIGGTGTEINIFTVSSSDDQLENNVTYKVGIRAINSSGAGPASDFVEVTPTTTAPGYVQFNGIGQNRKILIPYSSLDVDDGGSPLTSLEYSTDCGSTWNEFVDIDTVEENDLFIKEFSDTGNPLVNGVTVGIVLRATNSVGVGPPFGPTFYCFYYTPSITAPSKTIINSVTPGNSQLIVSVSNEDDGGSPILNYWYSTNNGECWFVPEKIDSSTLVIRLTTDRYCVDWTATELINGETYSIQIRAVNEIGAGDPSDYFLGTPSND